MSSYPTKGLVNRYWKRPKPRIYECNIRDAERFYKDSYNQYLQSKHFSASHGTKPTDIEEQFATRWTIDRMNSRLASQHDPIQRESSVQGLSADYGTNVSDAGGRSSKVTFSRYDSLTENNSEYNPPFRARSLVPPEREDMETENVESRLDRIKKLRAELGMKSDGTMDDFNHQNGASGKSILKKSYKQELPSDTRDFKSELSQNSYSNSASTSSQSRRFEPATNLSENRYSQKYERSTRPARNGEVDDSVSSFGNKTERLSRSHMTNDSEQYSTRSRYSDSKYPSDDKYSSSYRTKGSTYGDEDNNAYVSKYSRSAKKSSATLNGEENSTVDEDDELVSKIKKKFPTSDEILERIKKLDDDL